MAEFCPDCVRKVFGVKKRDEDFVLSKELCFCEECCEWKHVVLEEKDEYYSYCRSFLFRLFDK
jgi:hypothetical protein